MVSLTDAKRAGDRVRLSEDKRGSPLSIDQLRVRGAHKDAMLRNGLLISESMTPKLEVRIQEVCRRLGLPRSAVNAFVYNGSDVQADCIIDSPETCVLRFTSGLVNLMDEKEFQFVVAHEIGHFLLDHGACSNNALDGATENFMIQRARELSADRIGFLGTGSLDESIRAIIKTASGLNREFLRFDVSSFMSQAAMIATPCVGEDLHSTHPSLLIRCRALLWFSMSVASVEELFRVSDSTIFGIDEKVSKDLHKFVDGKVRIRKSELSDDVVLWKVCVLIINEGALKKDLQKRIEDELGESNLKGIKIFLDSYEKNELAEEATKRLDVSLKMLYEEFPSSADEIESAAFAKAYAMIAD